MIKNCKYFKCLDIKDCAEYKKGNCSGAGSCGYHNCGCDVCFEQRMEGDVEVCEIGLCLLEKDMEE